MCIRDSYILVGCVDETQAQRLEKLLHALGTGGIGGKVSAGYGAFSIEDVIPVSYTHLDVYKRQSLCKVIY